MHPTMGRKSNTHLKQTLSTDKKNIQTHSQTHRKHKKHEPCVFYVGPSTKWAENATNKVAENKVKNHRKKNWDERHTKRKGNKICLPYVKTHFIAPNTQGARTVCENGRCVFRRLQDRRAPKHLHQAGKKRDRSSTQHTNPTICSQPFDCKRFPIEASTGRAASKAHFRNVMNS